MKFPGFLLLAAALALAADPEPPEVPAQKAASPELPQPAEEASQNSPDASQAPQTASANSANAAEAQPGNASPETASPEGENQAGLQGELALRDSLLAANDSARAAEKARYETDIEVQNARCENWEKSYATIENEYRLCTKALGVYVESTEKYKQESNKRDMVGPIGSFVGGILIGVLIGWAVWN